MRGVWAGCNRISGRSRRSSNVQSSADSADALTEAWATILEDKFAVTEEEVLRAEWGDIGPASTREKDMPTGEQLDKCLHALAASKATGPDDIPAEVWRALCTT